MTFTSRQTLLSSPVLSFPAFIFKGKLACADLEEEDQKMKGEFVNAFKGDLKDFELDQKEKRKQKLMQRANRLHHINKTSEHVFPSICVHFVD